MTLGKVTFFSSEMRHALRAFIIHKLSIAFLNHSKFLLYVSLKNIVTQKVMGLYNINLVNE